MEAVKRLDDRHETVEFGEPYRIGFSFRNITPRGFLTYYDSCAKHLIDRRLPRRFVMLKHYRMQLYLALLERFYI